MDFRSPDGTVIRATQWGEANDGPPIVLQHGYVVNTRANWHHTGVIDVLVASGRRVIGIDARGHGRSDPATDPDHYGESAMAADLRGLLTDQGVSEFDLVGYSMGGVIALLVAAADHRVRRLVVGGIGAGVIDQGGVDRSHLEPDAIATAMADDTTRDAVDPAAWQFRELADLVGADRVALAAQARRVHRDGVDLAAIAAPTLVVAGRQDPLARQPERLVAAIGDARLVMLDGDHLEVPADPGFADAVVQFLN